MTEIAQKYTATEVESKIYDYWLKNDYFSSKPNDKKAYTIVIPPPNVTGVLHMGHMLNNTLQDVLIRRARMKGYNACWVPGTDHASIATEAKVVAKLKAQGIDKQSIGREKFLEHAWDWTHTHGGKILEQLKHLGCSCDWDRTQFTLNEQLSESVLQVFEELYNKGLIYRGYKMINWDPEALTNISDEEVNHVEKNGKLYHLKYKIVDSDEFLIVATTRPETIFGDNAVCVNPSDERYFHLKGKKVIVPLVNREIPIIEDEYVDVEFGTGCLKITPANDINDYTIGKKHNIDPIEIFNDNATLNQNGLHYQGKDRFVVRKEIAKELQSLDLLFKEEDYKNKVGTSERTGAIIEPKLSVQWFLKMEEIAKPALDLVLEKEIKFFPNHYVNTYKHWLENIHDWNISRQLWWGHQIPAYYYGPDLNDFVVAQTAEKALIFAQEKSKNPELTLSDLRQEKDVLDTWFSSWLWPMSVFNGINEPDNKEFNYYYPTQDLVTGPDIIFFWVARMIMAGKLLKDKIPFENVYFTGIVRDRQRRKMSKQLGNSPDPIELMHKYGADGVRVGMMLSSAAGNDLMFDAVQVDEDDKPLTKKQVAQRKEKGKKEIYQSALCEQGRNFSTKIWNGFKLVKGWKTTDKAATKTELETINWFENKYKESLHKIEEHFASFRISDALLETYKLVWDDYSSWYLELIKPNFGEAISKEVHQKTIQFLEDILKLLHPFMPFITEEIWQNIKPRTQDEALIIAQLSNDISFDEKLLKNFSIAKELVTSVRNFRAEKQLSPKEELALHLESNNSLAFATSIEKMANVKVQFSTTEQTTYNFIVDSVEYKIPFADLINPEEEKAKLEEEITYTKGFLQSVMKKLSNEKFVNSAPEKVVAIEQKKKEDAEEKIKILEKQLSEL